MATCPKAWSSPLVVRAFCKLILATWTYEEIEHVTKVCDAAMLPIERAKGQSTMAGMPLTQAALMRKVGY